MSLLSAALQLIIARSPLHHDYANLSHTSSYAKAIQRTSLWKLVDRAGTAWCIRMKVVKFDELPDMLQNLHMCECVHPAIVFQYFVMQLLECTTSG